MSDRTVFLSYRRDKIGPCRAGRIYDALTAAGFDPFLDTSSLTSGAWEEQILREVQNRAHFLLILTPGSLERCSDPDDLVRREYLCARSEQRNIVPVVQSESELVALRESCPPDMLSVFTLQIAFVNDQSFKTDLARIIADYIPRHKAPMPAGRKSGRSTQDLAGHTNQGQFQCFRSALRPFLQQLFSVLLIASLILGVTMGTTGAFLSIPIAASVHCLWLLSQLSPPDRSVGLVGLLSAVFGAMLLIKLLGEREPGRPLVWPRAEWTVGLLAIGFAAGLGFTIVTRVGRSSD